VAGRTVANSWRSNCSIHTLWSVNRHVMAHPRSHAYARMMAISFTFRFSAPLTVTLRRLTPVTYSSWVPSSKRMFLRSALPRKPFSGPEASRHSKDAAQTSQNDKTHSSCQYRRQDKFVNTEYDQGSSRSLLLDATLTAIMGIGIGEPQLWTVRLCCFHSLPHYMASYPSCKFSCSYHDVAPIFGQQAEMPGGVTQAAAFYLYTFLRTRSALSAPTLLRFPRRRLMVHVGTRFLSPVSESQLMLSTHPD
jgi:hypothetical protein